MEGYQNVKPEIEKIEFSARDRMKIYLKDGRIIDFPLTNFPSIMKLDVSQRNDWYVTDGQMFSFDECDEVFHLEQVLGKEQVYKYRFA
jgi:hypothetical protein